jgi:hypothetical protein
MLLPSRMMLEAFLSQVANGVLLGRSHPQQRCARRAANRCELAARAQYPVGGAERTSMRSLHRHALPQLGLMVVSVDKHQARHMRVGLRIGHHAEGRDDDQVTD